MELTVCGKCHYCGRAINYLQGDVCGRCAKFSQEEHDYCDTAFIINDEITVHKRKKYRIEIWRSRLGHKTYTISNKFI